MHAHTSAMSLVKHRCVRLSESMIARFHFVQSFTSIANVCNYWSYLFETIKIYVLFRLSSATY